MAAGGRAMRRSGVIYDARSATTTQIRRLGAELKLLLSPQEEQAETEAVASGEGIAETVLVLLLLLLLLRLLQRHLWPTVNYCKHDEIR